MSRDLLWSIDYNMFVSQKASVSIIKENISVSPRTFNLKNKKIYESCYYLKNFFQIKFWREFLILISLPLSSSKEINVLREVSYDLLHIPQLNIFVTFLFERNWYFFRKLVFNWQLTNLSKRFSSGEIWNVVSSWYLFSFTFPSHEKWTSNPFTSLTNYLVMILIILNSPPAFHRNNSL